MDKHIFTISEINHTVKAVMEEHPGFKNVYVRGEISNLVFNKSGHIYLSLKDQQASISAMIWKSKAAKLMQLNLQEGLEITCYGRLTYYVPTSKLSFEISDISVDGVGELQVLFDQRLRQIQAWGWTDRSIKQPIPAFVTNIGIITADTGAAVHDLITTIQRRMPTSHIYLFPAMVQGEFAKTDLVNKIHQANQFPTHLDVLIVGRGGGSYEDLWSFNEMEVLKAVVDSTIPIISAVGHEPDVTLIDYVADLRAPTPTAAGELATPNTKELLNELSYLYHNQQQLLTNLVQSQFQHLQQLVEQNIWTINKKITSQQQEVRYFQQHLTSLMHNLVDKQHLLIANLQAKNQLLNPTIPFQKGYGFITNLQDEVIKSVNQLALAQEIKIIIEDGTIISQVRKVQKHDK